jgi:hypothetical protein
MDPAEAEKCCECWEDISEEEAKAVLERTRKWAKYQQDNKIPYLQDESADPNDPAPKTMDCSYFVQKALGIELLRSMYEHKPKPERLSTRLLDGNCYFKRVKPEDTRAGDLVAQPRNSGPPGSQHVGTATGAPGAKGGHQGIAMGNGKNNAGSTGVSTWGVPRGPEGGSFDNADQLRVYRPQKRKKGCTDK